MANLDDWTDEVERVFCSSLSDGQRLHLVLRLVDRCSGYLLLQLTQHLESVSMYDFVRLLPDCAIHRLLSYLDVETLLTACQVSRSWNSAISGNQCIWRNLCSRSGFLVPAERSVNQSADSSFFKHLYQENAVLVRHLVKGFGAEANTISFKGHSDDVTAMFYYDGKLATGSHDRTVRIWCCTSGECLATYNTHSVSDIKLDNNFIVTASYDCSAACWDVTNGTKLRAFVGHTASVLCVDFNTNLNVLVTGSVDSTVKIWSFTDGDLLRTLEFTYKTESFASNVGKVKIWGAADCSSKPLDSCHILASNDSVLVDYKIRLSTGVPEKEDLLFISKNNNLFSGFHVDDSSLKVLSLGYDSSDSFRIVTETSFECIAVGGKRLVTQRPIRKILRLPVYMRTVSFLRMLRSGAGFDVIVGFRLEKLQWLLYVAGHNSDETSHFTIDLPGRTAHDGFARQLCICDTQWLDGISKESLYGRTLVAVATSDHSIELLKLKPLKCQ